MSDVADNKLRTSDNIGENKLKTNKLRVTSTAEILIRWLQIGNPDLIVNK